MGASRAAGSRRLATARHTASAAATPGISQATAVPAAGVSHAAGSGWAGGTGFHSHSPVASTTSAATRSDPQPRMVAIRRRIGTAEIGAPGPARHRNAASSGRRRVRPATTAAMLASATPSGARGATSRDSAHAAVT